MKKQKAYYTVHYTIDGAKARIKSKATVSSGAEILYAFHKFMQNSQDIEIGRYTVQEVHLGRLDQGLIRYEEFQDKPNPTVLRSEGGSTLFKQ